MGKKIPGELISPNLSPGSRGEKILNRRGESGIWKMFFVPDPLSYYPVLSHWLCFASLHLVNITLFDLHVNKPSLHNHNIHKYVYKSTIKLQTFLYFYFCIKFFEHVFKQSLEPFRPHLDFIGNFLLFISARPIINFRFERGSVLCNDREVVAEFFAHVEIDYELFE